MDEIEHGKKKRQILKEFIQLYESFPCLWHIKSKEYHDRELRTRAYKVLIKKLQQLQPTADRTAVVKKINCLRSNLRKEKRKTLEYLKAGRVYRSQLWYYNLFNFLNGINRPLKTAQGGEEDTVNMKVEDDKTNDDPLKWPSEIDEESQPVNEISQNDFTTEDESCEPTTYEVETLHVPRASKYINIEDTSNYEDVEANLRRTNQGGHMKEHSYGTYREGGHEDRHDIFGKNVAMKLRHLNSMSDTQKLMAEKVINDALYMAEMGLLTMEHCNVLK